MHDAGEEIGRIQLIYSAHRNIYENLALEEALFETLPPGTLRFLFYANAPSLVMGKHQNPWKECDVARYKRGELELARRITGGGTVYHDPGNLNYSFMQPKYGFDRRKNMELIAAALRGLGADANVSDRYDVLVDGRKVSGNAFCFRRERVLHHGTLLLNANLRALGDSLVGMKGIATHAVPSNPQPVMNLNEVLPELDAEALMQAVSRAVIGRPSGAGRRPSGAGGLQPEIMETPSFDSPAVQALLDRNRSRDWILGATPRFTVDIEAFSLPETISAGRLAANEPGEADAATPRAAHGGRPPATNGWVYRLTIVSGRVEAVELIERRADPAKDAFPANAGQPADDERALDVRPAPHRRGEAESGRHARSISAALAGVQFDARAMAEALRGVAGAAELRNACESAQF